MPSTPSLRPSTDRPASQSGDERRAPVPSPAGIIGVLGGMGPLATVDFMQKMLQATPVQHDQEHMPVLVSSLPQIPDRTRAYRGEGPSPVQAMLDSGRRLVAGGAGLVVVPCNTAHLWFDELQSGLGLPMLHIVDAALAEVQAQAQQGDREIRVGLLGTDATLASGLYVNRGGTGGGTHRHWVQPTAVEMVEDVMRGIGHVKAGDLAQGRTHLRSAADALVRRGAEVLVLACTEIPPALAGVDLGVPVVDATAALARAAVAWSRGQRREAVALKETPGCPQFP